MSLGQITWNPEPSAPALTLPTGAVDTHCHVFGPVNAFPYAPESRSRPGEAPKSRLFALHDMLGIARRVIVQAGVHGFDNAVVADAIAARPDTTRGTALVPPDIGADRIAALHAQGFRAVRYNYMSHLPQGASADELRSLGPRLAKAGWHLLVHMEPTRIEEMAPLLAKLPMTVVIDHMGRISAADGLDQRPFAALMRLLEHDHVWVKVSGCERASKEAYPYADATPFARNLVETFPDRVLWATDWPHPNFGAAPPDDGKLVDVLAEIAPDAEARRRLLVDNPTRLYDFPELT